MLVAIAVWLVAADVVTPPKHPNFDLNDMCRVDDLSGANEMLVRQEYYRDIPRWTRLFGIDVPNVGKPGYSGARQDLEILLGRYPDVYVEDDNPDRPSSRNAYYLQYVWNKGRLLQFELVRDGWATVNAEGQKGRYGKFLVAAEAEAKRLHEGRWATGN